MRNFKFLAKDSRQREPLEYFVSAGNVIRARELAEKLLAADPHYLSVEVWEGDFIAVRIERAQSKTAATRRT